MHGEAPKLKGTSLSQMRPAAELATDKPHGVRIKYLGGCRCIPCKAAASRYECGLAAKRRQGLGNGLVDAASVVAHLRELSKQGVGYKAVCEAAGVGKSSVMMAISGKRKLMRAANARAILAVTADMARRDGALVPAKATMARIKWLVNEGMTKTEIARRLGYKTRALQITKGMITARNAMKVEKLTNLMRLGE